MKPSLPSILDLPFLASCTSRAIIFERNTVTMPFDFKAYDEKCNGLTLEELQREWEHYTRLISGAATSTTVSGLAIPFTLGVSTIGVAMAAPAIHNARKKREIIEKHLNKLNATHNTRKRDVLGSMAFSGTIGVVTLGVGTLGADAVAQAGAEHGISAIAANETAIKVVTHAALDGAGMAVEHKHTSHLKKKDAFKAFKKAGVFQAVADAKAQEAAQSYGQMGQPQQYNSQAYAQYYSAGGSSSQGHLAPPPPYSASGTPAPYTAAGTPAPYTAAGAPAPYQAPYGTDQYGYPVDFKAPVAQTPAPQQSQPYQAPDASNQQAYNGYYQQQVPQQQVPAQQQAPPQQQMPPQQQSSAIPVSAMALSPPQTPGSGYPPPLARGQENVNVQSPVTPQPQQSSQIPVSALANSQSQPQQSSAIPVSALAQPHQSSAVPVSAMEFSQPQQSSAVPVSAMDFSQSQTQSPEYQPQQSSAIPVSAMDCSQPQQSAVPVSQISGIPGATAAVSAQTYPPPPATSTQSYPPPPSNQAHTPAPPAQPYSPPATNQAYTPATAQTYPPPPSTVSYTPAPSSQGYSTPSSTGTWTPATSVASFNMTSMNEALPAQTSYQHQSQPCKTALPTPPQDNKQGYAYPNQTAQTPQAGYFPPQSETPTGYPPPLSQPQQTPQQAPATPIPGAQATQPQYSQPAAYTSQPNYSYQQTPVQPAATPAPTQYQQPTQYQYGQPTNYASQQTTNSYQQTQMPPPPPPSGPDRRNSTFMTPQSTGTPAPAYNPQHYGPVSQQQPYSPATYNNVGVGGQATVAAQPGQYQYPPASQPQWATGVPQY